MATPEVVEMTNHAFEVMFSLKNWGGWAIAFLCAIGFLIFEWLNNEPYRRKKGE